jgi:Transferase family
MDFVRAFASQTIGHPLTTVPKQWMRNPLVYFPETCALSEIPGYTILPGPPSQSCSPPPPGPSEQVVLYIPTQNLAKLKSALGLTVSVFQLLTAVLWRASAACCVTELGDADLLYLAVAANGRERSPTKIMSQEHYFGNFVTDVTVSLKKSELLAKDGLSSVASSVQAALLEQLTANYIARRAKTFATVSFNQLVPRHQTKLTSWPKENTLDLHFGLTKPGKGQVALLPGEDLQFPVGIIHVMNLTDELYRVQLSVPVGKGEELHMHEELQTLVKLVDVDERPSIKAVLKHALNVFFT